MDGDDYEDFLELQDPVLKQQIAEGYAEYRRGETRPAREFIEELKAELERKQTRGSGRSKKTQ